VIGPDGRGRTMSVSAHKTDDELISDVRQGRMDAFRVLVQRHEPQVAATVIGMLGKGPEAQDVGQETFIRFYRSLDRFRGDASVGTYLTRIAMNLSLNALKRCKRQMQRYGGDTESLDGVPDETQRSDAHVEGRHIRDAIAKLSPKHRAVVVLRLLEERTTQETASILGVPAGTVLSRLARGIKALREHLEPQREVTHERQSS
jgi:RNA polymerase sigma-70 factor, ECF subfamily